MKVTYTSFHPLSYEVSELLEHQQDFKGILKICVSNFKVKVMSIPLEEVHHSYIGSNVEMQIATISFDEFVPVSKILDFVSMASDKFENVVKIAQEEFMKKGLLD